jgi:chromatin remodeling complex protein RSC6
MSTVPKQPRKPRKAKVAVPEAVAPQPVVIEEVAPVVEAVREPEPEVVRVHNRPARLIGAPEDTAIDAEAGSSEETAPVEKRRGSQKKKATYEDLKNDVDELLNKLLEDASVAKMQKNKELALLLKNYEKTIKKVRASVKKVEPREKRTVSRTQPSGFSKPLPITNEIAQFAGWNPTDLKSRTDVTNSLCDYIKRNNLQNPALKREIIPDQTLASLLRYNVETDPPLSYSTMQKHIGHLFVVQEPEATQ